MSTRTAKTGREAITEAQQQRNASGQFLPRHDPQTAHEVAATAIQAYVAGVSVQDIAAEYGVDRGIIYDWMLAELGPEQYRDLITRALVARVRRADEALEAAEEPHHIARAREVARFARMDLERRRPALYGPRQHVDISRRVEIEVTLQDDLDRLVTRIGQNAPQQSCEIDVSDGQSRGAQSA